MLLSHLRSVHIEEVSFGSVASRENLFLLHYPLNVIDEILSSNRFPQLKRVVFRIQNYHCIYGTRLIGDADLHRLKEEIGVQLPLLSACGLLVFDCSSDYKQVIPRSSCFFSEESMIHRSKFRPALLRYS